LRPAVFKVGLQFSSNGAAALDAIGAGSLNLDSRPVNNAIIAYLNKHGGIAGRKVEPSYNDIDATASPSAQTAQACAQWAQDDHVSLAIPSSAVGDNNALRECLKKAGIPSIYGNIFSTTLRGSFRSSPLYFEDGSLPLEDYAQTYVHGLAGQGFFTAGDKLGVIYYDNGPFTSALHSDFLPALKSVGVAAPVTFAANIAGGTELSSGSSQMSAAVLSFRSKGVTKVLFFEPWVGYFVFVQQATSQGYHPTYGLSSQEAPQVTLDLGVLDPQEMANARIVSWIPAIDTSDYRRYTGPRAKLCHSILHDAGVPPAKDQTTDAGQLGACEDLLLVRDAYLHAPSSLTGSDFPAGVTTLGSAVQLAIRQRGTYSPTNHWGTSQYYAGHFDLARSTFLLDGSPRPVR